MNYKQVAQITGKIMLVTAALLILPLIVGLIYRENTYMAFILPMLLMAAAGLLLVKIPQRKKGLYVREGFLIVTLSWLIISVVGAMPFVISGSIPSFIDAFFETVSGFTTTGSTILTDIEGLPKSMLFWRSFTHWIGGMGVLVFLLAISAGSDTKTMYIMRAESPGPKAGKLVSKMTHTARILYLIYIFLTALEVVFLALGKMPLFDALTTAFSTAGTGGFGVKNANIAAYQSRYFDYVIAVFMMLFGVNFGAYFLILTGKLKEAWRIDEVRWYLAIILTATALITLIMLTKSGIETAFRESFFAVSSTITTTGFILADYELWPTSAKLIILFLMFIGGCSSSTGGGIKVIRILVLLKLAKSEVKLSANPRAVRTVTVDGKAAESGFARSISAYFVVFMLVFALSALVISFDRVSVTEAFTSVATCINNVGPALERLGATGNFSELSTLSKLVLSVDMLLGRLELFPILALLNVSFWRK